MTAERRCWSTGKPRTDGSPAKLARALLTIASQDRPPRRFIAGADAIGTAEQKVAALKEDIEFDRKLSSSLDFDSEAAVQAR